MDAALEFRNVTKIYGGWWGSRSFRALDEFSISIRRGEIFGFLGPNGAGKTTAIHTAMGLMFPTSGEGYLLGERFGHPQTRKRVGFLAEHVALYSRPVLPLVKFYAELNGLSASHSNQRIRELLDYFDLSKARNTLTSKLSRGMFQKVGLIQAFANDPEIIILDEPTSALDPTARAAARELLLRAKAEGKTIFLSSHLLSEIEMICDRVGIIHHGKLARIGTLNEMLALEDECEIQARVGKDVANGALDVQDGIYRWRIKSTEQRELIEKIWTSGGEVISVAPARRSLEDMFLSLIAEESDRSEPGKR